MHGVPYAPTLWCCIYYWYAICRSLFYWILHIRHPLRVTIGTSYDIKVGFIAFTCLELIALAHPIILVRHIIMLFPT
jgi:hypothetical protein